MVSNINDILLQALDTFNTSIVSPIYYVMFTTLTIAANAIMFKVVCNSLCVCLYVHVLLQCCLKYAIVPPLNYLSFVWCRIGPVKMSVA